MTLSDFSFFTESPSSEPLQNGHVAILCLTQNSLEHLEHTCPSVNLSGQLEQRSINYNVNNLFIINVSVSQRLVDKDRSVREQGETQAQSIVGCVV